VIASTIAVLPEPTGRDANAVYLFNLDVAPCSVHKQTHMRLDVDRREHFGERGETAMSASRARAALA